MVEEQFDFFFSFLKLNIFAILKNFIVRKDDLLWLLFLASIAVCGVVLNALCYFESNKHYIVDINISNWQWGKCVPIQFVFYFFLWMSLEWESPYYGFISNKYYFAVYEFLLNKWIAWWHKRWIQGNISFMVRRSF